MDAAILKKLLEQVSLEEKLKNDLKGGKPVKSSLPPALPPVMGGSADSFYGRTGGSGNSPSGRLPPQPNRTAPPRGPSWQPVPPVPSRLGAQYLQATQPKQSQQSPSRLGMQYAQAQQNAARTMNPSLPKSGPTPLERANAGLNANNFMAKVYKAGDATINTLVKGAQERQMLREQQAAAPPSNVRDAMDQLQAQINAGAWRPVSMDELIVKVAQKAGIDPTQYSSVTQMFMEDEAKARATLMEGMNPAQQFITEAALSGADMLQNQMISTATGVPFLAVTGAVGGANSAQRALSEGHSASQAATLGAGSGLTTAAVESIGGVGGKLFNTPLGKSILSKLPQNAVNYIARMGQTMLGGIALDAVSEGGEEFLEYYLQNMLENIILNQDTPADIREALYGAGVGSLVGGVFGGGRVVANRVFSNPGQRNNSDAQPVITPQEGVSGPSNGNGQAQARGIVHGRLDFVRQVLGIKQGQEVSNSRAEQVLNDPILRGNLEQAGVRIAGTKSQQRQIVKDALKGVASQDQTGYNNIGKPLKELDVATASWEEISSSPDIRLARERAQFETPTIADNSQARQQLRQGIADVLYQRGSFSGQVNGRETFNGPIKRERRAYIVIGPPAAGKSSVFANALSRENAARIIDSDMAKEALPEFDGGFGAGRVHEESDLITSRMLLPKSLAAGENILVPLVGKNFGKIRSLANSLKQAGYTVQLYLNELPADKAARRAVTRFMQTGRLVDPDYVLSIGDKPTRTYEILKQEGVFDRYVRKSNDVPLGEEPILIEDYTPVQIQDGGMGGHGGGSSLGSDGRVSQEKTTANPLTATEDSSGAVSWYASNTVGAAESAPGSYEYLQSVVQLRMQAQEFYKAAQRKQLELMGGLTQALKGLDAQLVSGGAKSVESMVEKVLRKQGPAEGYGLASMKDHSRAAVLLKGFEDVPAAIEALKKRFPQITGEAFLDVPLNNTGYRGIHLTVHMGNGVNAEIQISTPQAWAIKKQTDAIYDKWRNVSEKSMTKKELMEKALDYAASAQLWENYYAGITPEVKRIASSLVTGLESSQSPNIPSKGTHSPLTNSTVISSDVGYASNLPLSVIPNRTSIHTPPNAQSTPGAPGFPTTSSIARPDGNSNSQGSLDGDVLGFSAGAGLYDSVRSTKQRIGEYFTRKPTPAGNRAGAGQASVTDGLGSGSAAFDGLQELLDLSRADRTKNPRQEDGVAAVLTERPRVSARENFEATADWLSRKVVDSGHTIDTVAKATGDSLLYPLYNNARQSRQAAQYMIGNAQTDINGNTVGPSLAAIMQPVRGKGKDYFRDFSNYLFHTHNIDRMSLETRGAEVYQEAIAALEAANPMLQGATREEIQRLASGASDYRSAALEWLSLDKSLNELHNKPVFGNSIGPQESSMEAARLLREHPEFSEIAQKVYAYNRNLMQYRIDAGLVSEKQANIMQALYPHYVPTFRKTGGTSGARSSGSATRIARTVREATGSNLPLLPIDDSMAEQTLQTVNAAKRNIFGARLLENALKHQDKVGRHVRSVLDRYNMYDLDEAPKLDGTFTIYVGGRPVSMDADAGIMEGIQALAPQIGEGNMLMKGAVKANNMFKALVTGYNPMFLGKNFARDLQDAGLYSTDLRAFSKNYFSAWSQMAKNGELWQLYQSMGGTGSSYFDYEKGLTVGAPRSRFERGLDKIELANMLVEQAPRFAEFMTVLEKGGRSYENIQKAMLAAADVTVNFGRSGTLTRTLNRTFVPFLNPSIQGADKFVRRFTQTKGAKEWIDLIGRAALLGILPALLNELLCGDDEEYQIISNRDKDTNYLFPIGDGVWVKIPKGRALSIFGNAAQRSVRTARGEEDAWTGFIDTAASQMLPTDPINNHFLAQLYNTHLFEPDNPGQTWYGSDIEPQRLRGLPPGERYDERTDIISKAVGGALNLSPKKINYLLDSYTGALGDVFLPMLTPKADRSPMSAAWSIDTVTTNRLSQDFYGAMDEMEQGKNAGTPTPGAALAYRYLSKVSREISEINKTIRAVENGGMEDAKKYETVRQHRMRANELYKNALDNLPRYLDMAAKLDASTDQELDAAYLEVNRAVFGAEYALKTYDKKVYEKAQQARKSLINYDAFYSAYFAQMGIEGDKDANGDTIPGSQSGNKKLAVDKATPYLTQKQREVLYEMFNIGKSVWKGYVPRRK